MEKSVKILEAIKMYKFYRNYSFNNNGYMKLTESDIKSIMGDQDYELAINNCGAVCELQG